MRGKVGQGSGGTFAGEGAGLRPNLIARCRKGDESAWVELYRTHQDRVIRYLRSYLGPMREVDDLVQQVFMEMVRSLQDFREDSSLNTWIFAIARHVANSHLRGEYRRDRRQQAFVQWTELTGLVASNPAAQTERTEVLEIVSNALSRMDRRHREVWLAVEVEGMNSTEAAIALNTLAGTVRSRLHRARAEVLKALSAAGVRGKPKKKREEESECVVTRLTFGNGSGGNGPGPGGE